MIECAQNVELALSIILISWLERNLLHRELDLIVVLLLDKLDDAILARAKALTHIVKVENLLGFQDTCQT